MEQPIGVAAAIRPRLMREIDLTAPSDQPDTEFSAKWRTRPIFGRVTTRFTFWLLPTFTCTASRFRRVRVLAFSEPGSLRCAA